VKLDPQFSRAWYNLGLAYSTAEKLNKAVEALEKAEALDRNSAEIPYAVATVLARMGLNREAKQAVQRALAIQPNSEAAMQLLRQLEQK
jgi:superkiller protein 3